ncbi:MAG: hypothetical protein HY698_09660 [Deltaproteobacteria bacterium]|nr:hypothetical protein [Deltaproteobacteria bacterium]
MPKTNGRLGVILFAALLAGCTACACAGAGAGSSLLGGLVATVLTAGGLFLLGATQSGCDTTSTCLSPLPPLDGGSDARPNACLGMPMPDGGSDAQLTPCLGMPMPDSGSDAPVGACLDPLPSDSVGEPGILRARERAAAVAKFRGRLPVDVLARLPQAKGDAS